jgi:trans-2,3-dihydro-3-hydroxyanthranilate isomerase
LSYARGFAAKGSSGHTRGMRLGFRLVDVFAERPLAGNQLCVVPETPKGFDAGLMQALAREIGFSESTFVSEAAGDRYHMRIFTPGTEMPFAGHPTLGTVFVLVSEGRVTSPATQVVRAGEFRVEVDVEAGFAWMEQKPAVFGEPLRDGGRVAAALGLGAEDLDPELPAQTVWTGLRHLLVALRGEDAVRRAAMDPPALTSLVRGADADACYLFAPTAEGAKARLFGPGVGVDEDAATGSAAGPLGAYLAEHGVAGGAGERLVIWQGEEIGRPSALHVEVRRAGDGWVPRVGGGVILVGRGEFEVGP